MDFHFGNDLLDADASFFDELDRATSGHPPRLPLQPYDFGDEELPFDDPQFAAAFSRVEQAALETNRGGGEVESESVLAQGELALYSRMFTGNAVAQRMHTTRVGLSCFPADFYGELFEFGLSLYSLLSGREMEQYLSSVNGCGIMVGQTGGRHPLSEHSRFLANTSTRGGPRYSPTVGHQRLLEAAAAAPGGPLAFLLEVEAKLDEACPPLSTGNRGLSEMPEGAAGSSHRDKPDEPGLLRENHVRIAIPGAARKHPVQFSQHQEELGSDGRELPGGERKVLEVTALYAFGPAANGEREYAEGEKAWHHRMGSRPGSVAAQSIARLIDRQWATYDAARVRDVLLSYLRERASTHGLTFEKSHESFEIPQWCDPKEGPDGAIDCVGGKGECKQAQQKKKRSAFQSHMGLAAAVGDAAEQQGLASGDCGGGGFTGRASTLAPAPAAPAAFRPQPTAPRDDGFGGFGGGFGGGGSQRRSAPPAEATPVRSLRLPAETDFPQPAPRRRSAPVVPTEGNRLGLMAQPARNAAESISRGGAAQGVLKAYANEQRVERGLAPLSKNAAQRHDWKGDAGLQAVLAEAQQAQRDAAAGGAPATRKRQRGELREMQQRGHRLSPSQLGQLRQLESVEEADDAALRQTNEAKGCFNSETQASRRASEQTLALRASCRASVSAASSSVAPPQPPSDPPPDGKYDTICPKCGKTSRRKRGSNGKKTNWGCSPGDRRNPCFAVMLHNHPACMKSGKGCRCP